MHPHPLRPGCCAAARRAAEEAAEHTAARPAVYAGAKQRLVVGRRIEFAPRAAS